MFLYPKYRQRLSFFDRYDFFIFGYNSGAKAFGCSAKKSIGSSRPFKLYETVIDFYQIYKTHTKCNFPGNSTVEQISDSFIPFSKFLVKKGKQGASVKDVSHDLFSPRALSLSSNSLSWRLMARKSSLDRLALSRFVIPEQRLIASPGIYTGTSTKAKTAIHSFLRGHT